MAKGQYTRRWLTNSQFFYTYRTNQQSKWVFTKIIHYRIILPSAAGQTNNVTLWGTFTLGCTDVAKWPLHLRPMRRCARDAVACASWSVSFFFGFPTHADSDQIGPYRLKLPIYAEIQKIKNKKLQNAPKKWLWRERRG